MPGLKADAVFWIPVVVLALQVTHVKAFINLLSDLAGDLVDVPIIERRAAVVDYRHGRVVGTLTEIDANGEALHRLFRYAFPALAFVGKEFVLQPHNSRTSSVKAAAIKP